MQTIDNTQVEAVRTMTIKELTIFVLELQSKIVALESKTVVRNTTKREMTDDDARRILSGDLKDTKHRDVETLTGLSYGQVYSCRLEHTFKHIHKEMKAAGTANPWVK